MSKPRMKVAGRRGKVEIDGTSYDIIYTTRAQYQKYKEYCLEWVNKLGLQGYFVQFSWAEIPGSQAQLEIYEDGKVLRFIFPKYVGEAGWESFDIRYAAIHEAVHALLGRLTYLGTKRCVLPEELDEEEEKVVVTLSTILTNRDWLKGGTK